MNTTPPNIEPFRLRVAAVVPALNEQAAIAAVVSSLRRTAQRVIVADNGSTDDTAQTAERAGAEVVHAARRGYGSACLAGIHHAINHHAGPPDITLFADGDGSDDHARAPDLIAPIAHAHADLVIGSRTTGNAQPGSLSPQQRFGNALACSILKHLYRVRYTDLGPFRAIRTDALQSLRMDDPDFGWTVQMQARAALANLHHNEIPTNYAKRVGKSKISGTIAGSARAGATILRTLRNEKRWNPAPRTRLAILAKLPRPGFTKTRLIPYLGPEQAAIVQHRLTTHTLRQAAATPHQVHLAAPPHTTPSEAISEARHLYGSWRAYKEQPQGDLGQRIEAAFRDAFDQGADRALVIGSDCPELTHADLRQASNALDHAPAVIGPAKDGGYWLMGITRESSHNLDMLFRDIPWSTSAVFQQTRQRLTEANLHPATLRTLSDVDQPEDLRSHESLLLATDPDA